MFNLGGNVTIRVSDCFPLVFFCLSLASQILYLRGLFLGRFLDVVLVEPFMDRAAVDFENSRSL